MITYTSHTELAEKVKRKGWEDEALMMIAFVKIENYPTAALC